MVNLKHFVEDIRFSEDRLKVLRDFQSNRKEYPFVVQIELTNWCNINCTMCSRKSMKRKIEFMDFELYKKLVNEVAELKVPILKLNVMWEPFLYPKIIEAIKYAKDMGIRYVMLSTNGILLDDCIIEKLLYSWLDKINFSVEWINEEQYRKARNNDNFFKVINNIEKLIKKRAEVWVTNPYITVSSIINLSFLHNSEIEIRNFWKNKVDAVDITGCIVYWELKENIRERLTNNHKCLMASFMMCILVDWSVSFCSTDYNWELVIWNWFTQSLKNLWKSNNLNQIREYFASDDDNIIKEKLPKCYACICNNF